MPQPRKTRGKHKRLLRAFAIWTVFSVVLAGLMVLLIWYAYERALN